MRKREIKAKLNQLERRHKDLERRYIEMVEEYQEKISKLKMHEPLTKWTVITMDDKEYDIEAHLERYGAFYLNDETKVAEFHNCAAIIMDNQPNL